MKSLIFQGKVKKGVGDHAKLKIPGRNSLKNAPPDWPETLCPGSLNIRIDGYPSEFKHLSPTEKVKNLDSKYFRPAFTIPQNQILNNSILPSTETPENGTAQIWRAILQIQTNENSTNQDVWVFRRIGSKISSQLELVSNLHLRQALSLSDGMQVIVKLQYD